MARKKAGGKARGKEAPESGLQVAGAKNPPSERGVAPKRVKLPDPANREELARWLRTKDRRWSVVIAARAALRAVPVAAGLFARRDDEVSILSVFRASAISRFAATYPNHKIGAAADDAAYAYAAAAAAALFTAAYASAALFAARAAASAAASAAAAADAAVAAGAAAARTAVFSAITHDIQRLNDGVAPGEIIRSPLWPESTGGPPDWAKRAERDLFETLPRMGNHWRVWADWYRDVFNGRAHDEKWDEAFVDLDPADPLPWDDGPQAVNARIAARLEALQRAAQTEKPKDTSDEVDEPALTQRPSSYRFDWRDERLEAAPAAEPPFDPVLAEALAADILAKGQDALKALRDNSADEIVERAVERALELLGRPVSEIAEGLLLSRFNTLVAHARAYADPASERERAIRAVIDDFATTLGNLVDSYPGVRAINANRIALAMQAEQAPQVEAELRSISERAHASPSVGESARNALGAGRDEVDDLTEKIERESNLALAAGWVKARGDAVAARLSDGVNFVSAVLVKAGAEIAGLHKETWREIRKTLPKAAARGVAKGTERATEEVTAAIGKAPLLLLAYWLVGPLGALAVLVPRLGAHKRKAEEIKAKVDKAIDADG